MTLSTDEGVNVESANASVTRSPGSHRRSIIPRLAPRNGDSSKIETSARRAKVA